MRRNLFRIVSSFAPLFLLGFFSCVDVPALPCESHTDCQAHPPALFCRTSTSQGTKTCQPAICKPGTQEACPQPKGLPLPCKAGQRLCLADAMWSDCFDRITPLPELCDGIDNDCNGKIDDLPGGCKCDKANASRECFGGPTTATTYPKTPDSPCRKGVQYCGYTPDGTLRWGPCLGQTLPTNEICDGLDNDCNGKIDDSPPCDSCRNNNSCTTSCSQGFQRCGSICTDLKKDAKNCGDCGRVCGPTRQCVLGDCTLAPPLITCTVPCNPGICHEPRYDKLTLNPMTDKKHCGTCDNACDFWQECVQGRCQAVDCPKDETVCGDRCFDLQTSAQHCGRCGNTCAEDTPCFLGACRSLSILTGQVPYRDGPAAQAAFRDPRHLFYIAPHTLYITDTGNHAIRKLDLQTMTVSTVHGDGFYDKLGFRATSLKQPEAVVISPEQDSLYLIEHDRTSLRRYAYKNKNIVSGIVLSRSNAQLPQGSPAGLASSFIPKALTLSPNGKLYIADIGHHVIREFDPATEKETIVAGYGGKGYMDGLALQAKFHTPSGLDFGTDGHLYVADTENHRIRKIDLSRGLVSTVAGTGQTGSLDGPPSVSQLFRPVGLLRQGSELLIADANNHRIRAMDVSSQRTSTLLGKTAGFQNGTSADARLHEPLGLAQRDDDLYIADSQNHVIRVYHRDKGHIETLAGIQRPPFRDGSFKEAAFQAPGAIVYDKERDCAYIADVGNHRIRKLDLKKNTVITIAGDGLDGSKDGPALQASFGKIQRFAFKPPSQLFVLDARATYEHTLRLLDLDTMIVTTLTGDEPKGYREGPIQQAQFHIPLDIAIGPDGNLYIADTYNHQIRKLDLTNMIASRFAGIGKPGLLDNVPAQEAKFYRPQLLTFDNAGHLYVIDDGNQRIRKIDPKTNKVTTPPEANIRYHESTTQIQILPNGNLLLSYGFGSLEELNLQERASSYRNKSVIHSEGFGLGFKEGPPLKTGLANIYGFALTKRNELLLTEGNHLIRILK